MKEPLVLLPGMMCDARLFGPQIAELSCDMAVTVAPVTIGERIEEIASSLLDILPKRFALAGLSLGGVVAMEILRRGPRPGDPYRADRHPPVGGDAGGGRQPRADDREGPVRALYRGDP
jgi:pimeloyl-ACP methyl ester carboxylesterase